MSTGSSIDSGTGTPANGRGASSSAVAVAGSSTPVRWVVLFTGRTATDDYQPSATTGEKPSLVKEVTDVCVAFHPHSDIRLFPASGEALLFYRAKSTSEWVITRVATAPNPEGVRTALEYTSVVLGGDDFKRLLGGNPFSATGAGGLLDRVREHFLSGETTPVSATVAAPATIRVKSTGSAEPAAPFGAEAAATPENAQALQDYFATRSPSAGSPPTFASWWSSGGHLPSGYFDIVLRAPVARAVSLRDAADAAVQLANEVKAAMPRIRNDDAIASDLARSILASADAAQQAVSHAASHLNTETPVQFQAQLTEAARLAGQLVSDISALTKRLGSTITSTELARLNDMSQRGEELVRDLPRVRHPNPFARRSGVPESNGAGSSAAVHAVTSVKKAPAASVAARPGAGGVPNTKLIVGGIVSVIVVFGLWGILGRQSGHGSQTAAPSPSKVSGTATPSGTAPSAGPTGKPGMPFNPVAAALISGQSVATSSAKDSAAKAAVAAVLAKNGAEVDQDTIEKIAATAMTTAFHATLPAKQATIVYGNGTPWTFAHYRQVVPALAMGVHEAALVAATQEISKIKVSKATQAVVSQPTPRERPRTRTPEENPTPEPQKHHHEAGATASDDSASNHHKTAPAVPAPVKAPKAGSADSTGL